MDYEEIANIEIKVDCYDGPNFDQLKKYWWAHFEGDMDADTTSSEIFELYLKSFPPGTKIKIEVPICPECDMIQEFCDCGFDWEKWIIGEYS